MVLHVLILGGDEKKRKVFLIKMKKKTFTCSKFTAIELFPETMQDTELLNMHNVKVHISGTNKLKEVELVRIVPIGFVVGQQYEEHFQQMGHLFGYTIRYINKHGKPTLAQVSHIFE